MIEQALILAAGAGSRIVAHVAAPHKAMVEVGGKPLLQHTCERLQEAGVRDIVIAISEAGRPLRALLEGSRAVRADLTFAINDDWERGNGTSVLAAADLLEERFILTMADHLFDPRIVHGMCEQHVDAGQVKLAVDLKLDEIHDMDDATKALLEDDRVSALGKGLRRYSAVDTGIFACSRELAESVRRAAAPPAREVTLSAGLEPIIASGRLQYYDIGASWWQDVDTPSALRHAESLLRRANPV